MSEANSTLQLLLRVNVSGAPRSVVVDLDPSSSCHELIAVVAPAVNSQRWRVARTGQVLDPNAPVASLRLRHGDLLEPAGEAGDRNGGPTDLYSLLVVGGPLAGTTFQLSPGEYVIGRTVTAEVSLALKDPSISGRHCLVRISSGGLEIQDLGSSNGTWLRGRRLGELPEPLPFDEVVEIGGSLIQIEPPTRRPEAAATYRGGRMLFNRPARVPPKVPERSVTVPEFPKEPEGRDFPLVASLGPLVLGVGMAVLLKNPIYLAFAVLSPAMAVFSLVGDRRSGRRGHRKALAACEVQKASAEQSAAEFKSELVALRHQAAPSPAHLAKRATELDPSLWERRAADDDFLALRVGSATLPTLIRFVDEHGAPVNALADSPVDSPSRFVSERSTDADVPLVIPFRDDGVLGVAGSLEQRESLGRSSCRPPPFTALVNWPSSP